MRTDARTKAALRRLIRHRTIQPKALADDLGVAYRTLMAWLEPEGVVPSLDQVRQVLKACARYDAAEARRLAEEVYGLADAGWFLAAAPPARPCEGDLVREVLEASAATGAVTGWAAEATADGRVDWTEAERGERAIAHALQLLAQAKAQVHSFRAPQGVLAGVAT